MYKVASFDSFCYGGPLFKESSYAADTFNLALEKVIADGTEIRYIHGSIAWLMYGSKPSRHDCLTIGTSVLYLWHSERH